MKKGEYGYLAYWKKRRLWYILGLSIVLVLFLFLRHWFKETWLQIGLTVVAVLWVLPIANLIAPFLITLPYKGVSGSTYEQTRNLSIPHKMAFDLIVTSHDFILPLTMVCVYEGGVLAYSPKKKINFEQIKKQLNVQSIFFVQTEDDFFTHMEQIIPDKTFQEEEGIRLIEYLLSLSI